MNKKTLLLILLGILVLPTVIYAEGGVDTIAKAVQTAVVSIGVPLIIVGWIVAGILYLTSAGSPEKTGTAKKALIAAVVGTALVIVASQACTLVNTTFQLGGTC